MVQVSILVTTYNRAHTLDSCLNSVLRQTFCDYEVIIVDDGSYDGTEDVLAYWRTKFESDRFISIVSSKNMGRNFALTLAQRIAKGKYSIWLDSDDYFYSTTLEDLVAFAESRDAVMVYGWHWERYKEENFETREPKFRKREGDIVVNDFDMIKRMKCIHPKLYRTKEGRENWFNPSLKAAIDYDFTLRMNEKYPIYFLDKRLYVYSIVGDDRMGARGENKAFQRECARQVQLDALARRGIQGYTVNHRNQVLKVNENRKKTRQSEQNKTGSRSA